MRKAGAKDYKSYSKQILKFVKQTCFQRYLDEHSQMINQAIKINNWVKMFMLKFPYQIPKGKFMKSDQRIKFKNIKLNITAVYTAKQTEKFSKT